MVDFHYYFNIFPSMVQLSPLKHLSRSLHIHNYIYYAHNIRYFDDL